MNKTHFIKKFSLQIISYIIVIISLALVIMECAKLNYVEINTIEYSYQNDNEEVKTINVDSTISMSDTMERGGLIVRYQDTTIDIDIPSNAVVDVQLGEMIDKDKQIAHDDLTIYQSPTNGRIIDVSILENGDTLLKLDPIDNYEIKFTFNPWLYSNLESVVSSGNMTLLLNGKAISADVYSFGFDEQNNLLKLIFRNIETNEMIFNKVGVELVGKLSDTISYILFPEECVKELDESNKTIVVSKYDKDTKTITNITLEYYMKEDEEDVKYWVENNQNLSGTYIKQ